MRRVCVFEREHERMSVSLTICFSRFQARMDLQALDCGNREHDSLSRTTYLSSLSSMPSSPSQYDRRERMKSFSTSEALGSMASALPSAALPFSSSSGLRIGSFIPCTYDIDKAHQQTAQFGESTVAALKDLFRDLHALE